MFSVVNAMIGKFMIYFPKTSDCKMVQALRNMRMQSNLNGVEDTVKLEDEVLEEAPLKDQPRPHLFRLLGVLFLQQLPVLLPLRNSLNKG